MSCASSVSRSGIGRRAEPEQRDVHRLAGARAERGVELADLRLAVAGGGRQQADLAASARSASAEHVVVEGGVVRLHREAAPAHGEDRGPRSGGGKGDLRPLAEIGGLQRELDDLVADGLDPVGARLGAREHDAVQVLADEVQRGAVRGRIAAGQLPSSSAAW